MDIKCGEPAVRVAHHDRVSPSQRFVTSPLLPTCQSRGPADYTIAMIFIPLDLLFLYCSSALHKVFICVKGICMDNPAFRIAGQTF